MDDLVRCRRENVSAGQVFKRAAVPIVRVVQSLERYLLFLF